MDYIIEKIIEFEYKAKEIVREAEERLENQDMDISAGKEQINEKIRRKAVARVEEMQAREEAYQQEKLEEMEVQARNSLECLNINYSQNKQKWVSEIVGNIRRSGNGGTP